jgi:proteasome lid subunit RPN8/RPN11
MRVFVLPDTLHEQLIAEARAAYPNECCGLIEGSATPEGWRATALHGSKNLAADPAKNFLIDPQVHFDLLRRLRGTGRAIIGCYHSHPGGLGQPSERDRAEAMDYGFVWLIAGEDEVNAYLFDAGARDFAPLKVCRSA